MKKPALMANSYRLPDDLSQVNYSSTDLLMYSRNGNANQHWLEEIVPMLKDGVIMELPNRAFIRSRGHIYWVCGTHEVCE